MNVFLPNKHGFHFSNNDIHWSFGPFTGAGLCGGMVYGALDYFLSGMHIPINQTAPQEGDILHQYLYDRQVQAHWNTVPTFFAEYEKLPKVRAEESVQVHQDLVGLLNGSGLPMPLCLTHLWKGHHVLAIAAAMSDVPGIVIYDPNYPDKLCGLRRTGQVGSASGWKHDVSGETWAGIFIDKGYKRQTPTLICGEANWRWCVKCQALFWNGADGGRCPAGGTHSAGGVKNYVIAVNEGTGEFGWAWCKDCQGMWLSTAMSVSTCPVRGNAGHSISSDNRYVIPKNNGIGEGGWRQCRKCISLYWSGNMGNGTCPRGGNHDPSGSGEYFLVSVKA